MLARCKSCHGVKKILKMGFVEVDCKACNGTGYQALDEVIKPQRFQVMGTGKKTAQKQKPSNPEAQKKDVSGVSS